MCNKLIDITLN